MPDLLHDPDGSPYPEEVQALYRRIADATAPVHDALTGAGDMLRDAIESVIQPVDGDSLPQWLAWRFGGRATTATDWADVDGDDQDYWKHEAAAVRRAVARGGFKPYPPSS